MKYVRTTRDIPKDPHWAILTNSSVSIPGDERSRTNPGHGYPASTEYYISYEAYSDQEEWQKRIAELEGHQLLYTAMYVQPAQVTTDVKVTVKT